MKERIKIGRIGVDRDGFMNIPVDRSTPLGNPFPRNRSRSREQAIEAFREYLYDECANPRGAVFNRLVVLLSYLEKGKRLNLQCWCSPNPCHAEVIREVLLELLQLKNSKP